jgi:hypothetical protein
VRHYSYQQPDTAGSVKRGDPIDNVTGKESEMPADVSIVVSFNQHGYSDDDASAFNPKVWKNKARFGCSVELKKGIKKERK